MIKVVKSKRKTISILVDNYGKVIVKAPYFLSDDKIFEYVKSKQKWIDNYVLKNKKIYSDNLSIINKKNGLLFGKIVDFTEDFYKTVKRIAKDYLSKRLEFLANKYNFSYGKIIIKNYKSRWGTCYKNKDISLNQRLVMLSEDLIDYVILHELCHTVEFNHQVNFYKLLSNIINEKKLKKALKEKSFILKIDY